MTDKPQSLPGLLEGGRKPAFLVLGLLASAEVGAQVAAAAALKSVLIGAAGGPFAALLLLASGALAALFAWGRTVAAERFGQRYVNQLRVRLAHQAVAVAGSGGPGRFGTLAIRMSGDLAALKDWADKGMCGGFTGLFSLAGAFAVAWVVAGEAGVAATAVGPVLAVVVFAVFYVPLRSRLRDRRRARGRLSAKIGDLLLSAASSVAYAAQQRAVRPVRRAGDAVLRTSCREAVVATLLLVPAIVTLPFGAAAAVLLSHYGWPIIDGIAGWAGLLFALSLAAAALRQLAAAATYIVERSIAAERITRLFDEADGVQPAAPSGSVRLPPGPAVELAIDGEVVLAAGECSVRCRDSFVHQLEALLQGQSRVTVDGRPASDIYAIDWARRVSYAGPLRPLKRGRLTQVLAAKRNAREKDLATAIDVAGLDADWLASNPLIDPRSPQIAEPVAARLRLARALAHRPRALLVDDPWLTEDPALCRRLVEHCRRAAISVLFLSRNEQLRAA